MHRSKMHISGANNTDALHSRSVELASSAGPGTLLAAWFVVLNWSHGITARGPDSRYRSAPPLPGLRPLQVTLGQGNLLSPPGDIMADAEKHCRISSKTDSFRLGTPLVVPKVGGVECPYAALRLFCPVHLRSTLSRLGLDTSQYAGHSFRRGAATWAVSQGIDADTIKLLGWWNSDCYRRYVDRSAAERRTMVAAALYSTRQGPLVPTGASWRDPVL
ncbi:uncharacterized protein UHOD_11468 [Ustilago sp. UG-2017b]|nr:uncharacterized protein UHOD_11468 [Ustilago sp. UG-2017b]